MRKSAYWNVSFPEFLKGFEENSWRWSAQKWLGI